MPNTRRCISMRAHPPRGAPVVTLAEQRAVQYLPELTPARLCDTRLDEPAAFSRGGGG